MTFSKSFYTTLLFFILIVSCNTIKDEDPTITKHPEDISIIENGLIPGFVIKGNSINTKSLADEMQKHNIVGVSLAVIKDGKIEWAKGYGSANKNLDLPIDSSTLFQAASISKPITAMGVLKLMEEGKLDLDVDVNNYLKNYQIADNKFTLTEKVTLRRLLNHTAGTNVHGFPGYKSSDSILSTLDVLNGNGNTEMVKVDTIPGTRYKYSGGGYTIVQKVIEDITGLEFSEYMDENVLKPLSMQQSTFRHLNPANASDSKYASAAFNGEGKQVEGDWHVYPEKAAASLWTTPSDLARYIIEVQNIYQNKRIGFLKPESVQLMLAQNENQYGLGHGLSKQGDSLMFHHSGKNEGFTNVFVANAAKGQGLVIMTNSDNGGRILSSIERAVSKQYNWGFREPRIIDTIKLSNDFLQKFVGTYKYIEQVPSVGGDYLAKVRIENNSLVANDVPENVDYNLIATDSLNFLDIEKNERIAFKKINDEFVLIWNNRFEFRRLE